MKGIGIFYAFLLLLMHPASAQEAVMDAALQKQIKILIQSGKYTELETVLTENKEKPEYNLIENFIILQAKELVQKDQLDSAQKILEIVLNLNLLNDTAQELYLSIDRIKKESAALKEEKLRIEEELKKKQELEQKKAKNDQLRKEAESISLSNLMLVLEIEPLLQQAGYTQFGNTLNWKTGFSGKASILFYYPYFSIGITGLGCWQPLTMSGVSAEDIYYAMTLFFGIPVWEIPLYPCAGIYGFKINSAQTSQLEFSYVELLSPTAGITLRNLKITPFFSLYGNIDYLLVSLWAPELNFGAEFALLGVYRLWNSQGISLSLQTEIQSVFLYGQSKWETNSKLKIGIRAGFNEK